MHDMDFNQFMFTDEQRRVLIERLHPIHEEWAKKLQDDVNRPSVEDILFTMALEQFLQGLGAEGYEFS